MRSVSTRLFTQALKPGGPSAVNGQTGEIGNPAPSASAVSSNNLPAPPMDTSGSAAPDPNTNIPVGKHTPTSADPPQPAPTPMHRSAAAVQVQAPQAPRAPTAPPPPPPFTAPPRSQTDAPAPITNPRTAQLFQNAAPGGIGTNTNRQVDGPGNATVAATPDIEGVYPHERQGLAKGPGEMIPTKVPVTILARHLISDRRDHYNPLDPRPLLIKPIYPLRVPMLIQPTISLFLPTPTTRFPAIATTAYKLRDKLDAGTLKLWSEAPGPKLLVCIANDFPQNEAQQKIAETRDIIKAIVNCPTMQIGPGSYTKGSGNPQFPDYPAVPLCLTGLTEAAKAKLLQLGCANASTRTIFFFPFEPFVDDHPFSIQGIYLDGTDADATAVSEIVARQIKASTSLLALIRTRRDNLPSDLSPDEAVTAVVNSIYAVPVFYEEQGGAGSRLRFNIYIVSPTKIPDHHQQWIALLRKLKFPHLAGVGSVAPPVACTICYSTDHTTGLCRYTDFADEGVWNKIMPRSSGNFRGRGRGRGRAQYFGRGR